MCFPRLGLPIFCLLVAFALPSAAQMYQWTDAEGRLRFSDVPPPDGQAEKVEGRIVREARVDELGGKLPYPKYAGTLPSKLLKVSPPRLWLQEGAPGLAVVGTDRTGENCERVRPRRMSNAEWAPPLASLVHRIAASMGRSGYEVIDVGRREVPHYRLLPLVTELHADACEGGHMGLGRATARIEVRWELSELAGGRKLHTVTTQGTWSGRSVQFEDAIAEAMFEASIALFEDREFTKYLHPRNRVIPPRRANLYDESEVPPLAFDFGPAPGLEFASVQKSVVTVRVRDGHGSGFVVASGGWILTNWHVVKDAATATVVFAQREVPATVVRVNPQRDVALLRTDLPIDVDSLSLASQTIGIGESVYVVGTPFNEGLSQTVTRGIISAVRERGGQTFLQTDAALNPGNSGGPALNEAGQVIGIAVGGSFSRVGGALNINYLIPITDALEHMALQSTNENAPASLAPSRKR